MKHVIISILFGVLATSATAQSSVSPSNCLNFSRGDTRSTFSNSCSQDITVKFYDELHYRNGGGLIRVPAGSYQRTTKLVGDVNWAVCLFPRTPSGYDYAEDRYSCR